MWPLSGDMMLSHDYQMRMWDFSRGPGVQGSVKPLGFFKSVRHPSAVSDDDEEDHEVNLRAGYALESGS